MEILYVILGILALVVIFVVATYNHLITLRNAVKDQWSQIEIILKKRADLIPNLVETVKGYAKHETSTFEAVINARNKAVSAQTPSDEMQANGELTQALGKLFALSEAYPDLKANTNFLDLQTNLKDVETQIAHARQFYNDSVLSYKNKLEVIPSNFVAGMFGFKPELFFEATEEEKATPQVKF